MWILVFNGNVQVSTRIWLPAGIIRAGSSDFDSWTFREALGDTHPIGQEITLVTNGKEIQYKIGGVLEKLNDMEMFNFDLLVNFETQEMLGAAVSVKDSWNSELWTFVQIDSDSHSSDLSAGLEGIRKSQNKINPEKPYLSLELVAYTDLISKSDQIENGRDQLFSDWTPNLV